MLVDPQSIALETLADYYVRKIEQDSEVLVIDLFENSVDSTVIIRCKDYIGFEIIGLWDDSIVKSISIDTSGDLIEKSLQKVRVSYDGPDDLIGCVKKTYHPWKQITIKLIDGVELKVACAEIVVEN